MSTYLGLLLLQQYIGKCLLLALTQRLQFEVIKKLNITFYKKVYASKHSDLKIFSPVIKIKIPVKVDPPRATKPKIADSVLLSLFIRENEKFNISHAP